MSADKALPDFDGDQKDQLSWMLWTAVWMSKVRAACKPGAPICVFIDWRQLPALACAMQWAGWIWRGVAVWDKMTSRPQKGRYRQQAEFMVWGSNGPMPLQRKVGCLPGVFRHANPANRIYVTEKPLPLMHILVVQPTAPFAMGDCIIWICCAAMVGSEENQHIFLSNPGIQKS